MPKTFHFEIPGISCVSCVSQIENVLNQCDQLNIAENGINISVVSKRLIITLNNGDDLTRNLIVNLIDEIGFECITVETHEIAQDVCEDEAQTQTKSFFKKNYHWLFAALGIISGVGVLTLSFFPALSILSVPVAIASSVLTVILGYESYIDAWKKYTKARILTMDTLFSISTLSIITVSLAAFAVPWLPAMFDAGLLIFGFRHLGLGIEKTIKQSVNINTSFVKRLPESITQITDSGQQETFIKNLKPDDVILLQPGAIIPVNGVCLSDNISICDKIITGSIWFKIKNYGDKLIAGIRLAPDSPPLTLKVDASVNNSYLKLLDDQNAKALQEKAPLETVAKKILQYFIPAVIGLSLVSAFGISLFFPVSIAIQCAVTVLVSACPCTLGFIIPLAVSIGMYKASSQGIIFKNSKMLQAADKVDMVVFDLNGTLTEGVPKVSATHILDQRFDEQTFLRIIGALEQYSEHSVAVAISQYVKEKVRSIIPFKSLVFEKKHHAGLRAKIGNHRYTIGNKEIMENENIPLPDTVPLMPGDSIIYLARNQKIIGYLIMTDPLRTDSVATIEALREQGKTVKICTGADWNTAFRYGEVLNIPPRDISAQCYNDDPEQNAKALYIDSLSGNKAFVGDSANDSVAVNSCFGIAIKSTEEQFEDPLTLNDAAVNVESPSFLPKLFEISHKTVNIIKQNLIFSFAYNLITIAVASGLLMGFGVMLSPAVGAGLMVAQSFIILSNSIRFYHQDIESNTAQLNPTEDAYNIITDNLQINNRQIQSENTLAETKTSDVTDAIRTTSVTSGFTLYARANTSDENITTDEALTRQTLP